MEEYRLKFGISLEEIGDGRWSIGMCHEGKETYLYVNLLILSFSIGRMYLPA